MTEPPPTFPELYGLDVGEFADGLLFYERLAKRGDSAVLDSHGITGRLSEAHLHVQPRAQVLAQRVSDGGRVRGRGSYYIAPCLRMKS